MTAAPPTAAIKRAADRIKANSLAKASTGQAYTPRGAAVELLVSPAKEVLLSGPAGTGKSRACLQKIHYTMEKYKQARALIVRKTRASLSETGLQTFEDHVLGLDHPLRHGAQRMFRQSYRYPNGSQIVIGGMDNPVRIMSSEYDLIYVQEAIELQEGDWNNLTTRLRNNKVPYQQIIADTNPDSPHHWLKVRCDTGKTKLVLSEHEDNPVLYDADLHNWTEFGEQYLATLDLLTGATYDRLRKGLWVQATGIIFDTFNEKIHKTERADYDPALGAVYWYCDDGYAYGSGPGSESYHPRVVLLAQETPLGGINVFKEYHKCHVAKYTDTIEEVLAWTYPAPDAAYVDSAAAMFRGELTLTGITNTSASHKVEEGIKNVQRMLFDGNGMALIHVHPRCRETIREFQSYRRTADGLRILKQDDHSCFTADTRIAIADGYKPICQVAVGDQVWTRQGYRTVTAAQVTDTAAEVWTLVFSNGATLEGTANHPIWVNDTGWKTLGALEVGDRVNCLSSKHIVRLVFKEPTPRTAPVYNLTVEEAHEYFASGLLVSNCDAIRYGTWHLRYGL